MKDYTVEYALAYDIIEAMEKLEILVKARINEGYEPQGGVDVTKTGNTKTYYIVAQAMYKK